MIVFFSILFPMLAAAGACVLPLLWSRDGMLLGTRVSDEFARGADARRIKRRYAVAAAGICVSSIGLALTGVLRGHGWMLGVSAAWEGVGLLWLWVRTWGDLRPFRSGGRAVRRASLTMRSDERTWWPGTLAAMLPLILSAGVLWSRWNTIPERFPIHWGMDGRPNGWGGRNVLSLFGPLVAAGVLVMVLTLLGELSGRYSPGHAGRPAMLRLTRNALRTVAWMISLLFCTISLSALAHDPAVLAPIVVLGSMCSSLGLVVYLVYRSMQMPEAVLAAQRTTEDRFWKGGLLYFNPEDGALMVPKREGVGYTMNFGRPVSWVILGGLVVVAVVLPLLIHFAGR